MSVKLETAKQERPKAPRAKLPRIIRVRPFDFRLSEEVCRPQISQKPGCTLRPRLGTTTQA